MEKRNNDLFALVLRLPKGMVEELDAVANALRMSRTALIKRSITRNLGYAKIHELPVMERPEIRAVLES